MPYFIGETDEIRTRDLLSDSLYKLHLIFVSNCNFQYLPILYFLFNVLNSIQMNINRSQNVAKNYYLSDFGINCFNDCSNLALLVKKSMKRSPDNKYREVIFPFLTTGSSQPMKVPSNKI